MGGTARRPLIGALLRTPHNAVVDHVHGEFRRAGFGDIGPAYFPVFQHIDHDHGSRISWLAERGHVSKQTMGHLVGNLEDWGYVEVVMDASDSRAKLVRMTKKGRQVHDLADQSVRRLEQRWARRLGERRFEELRALLVDLGTVAGDSGQTHR